MEDIYSATAVEAAKKRWTKGYSCRSSAMIQSTRLFTSQPHPANNNYHNTKQQRQSPQSAPQHVFSVPGVTADAARSVSQPESGEVERAVYGRQRGRRIRQRPCNLSPESGSCPNRSWIVTGIRDELLRIGAATSERWRRNWLGPA